MEIIITLKKTDKEYPIKLSRRQLKKLERMFNAQKAKRQSGYWTIKAKSPLCAKHFSFDKECSGCPLHAFSKNPSKDKGCIRLLREILDDNLFFRVSPGKVRWMDCVDSVARHKLKHLRGKILDIMNGKAKLDIW